MVTVLTMLWFGMDSTMVVFIAGIVGVTSGQVTNRANRIGYVFQEPRLLP